MNNHIRNAKPRRGTAAVLILLLTSLLFIALVFSLDIGRMQLAQLELQSGTDLAARAGAEALSRGVGDPDDNAITDAALRAEIDMIARLNQAGGKPIVLDLDQQIEFGAGTENMDGTYSVTVTSGNFDDTSDAMTVNSSLPDFNVIFGAFVSRDTVELGQRASSMVRERDIVVVLDRSTSMLKHDGGEVAIADYNANLRALEDALYEGDENRYYYPGGDDASSTHNTEFQESGGNLILTRTQALKLAVLNFRAEIDRSRGFEQLGLVTYSNVADAPAQASTASGPVDIIAGLSTTVFDSLVGDGINYENEYYATNLTSHLTGYREFDYNYLGQRYNGGTNVVDGLIKGADVLYGPGRRAFATPLLIILTDGQHNQSGDPETTATQLMAAHPEMQIYTISFGADADQTTMGSIATIGRGKHHHASNVSQLIGVFQELASAAGVALIE